jgi:hypothetical protein
MLMRDAMDQSGVASRRDRPALPLLAALVLALVGLATGGGLVVYFIAGVSLRLALAVVTVLIAAAAGLAWPRLTPEARRAFKVRAWAGARAGLLATLAYDLTRLATVELLGLSVNPFEAIPLFGQLLAGGGSATTATNALGIAYHAANGIGFGLAYGVVAGERGVVPGVLWGLGLEAAMLTFYPGWLDIRAIQEFFGVSVLGHLAYGATLGWTARRLLRDTPPAGPSASRAGQRGGGLPQP